MIVILELPSDLAEGSVIEVDIDERAHANESSSIQRATLHFGIGGGWDSLDITEHVRILPPDEWRTNETQTELELEEENGSS